MLLGRVLCGMVDGSTDKSGQTALNGIRQDSRKAQKLREVFFDDTAARAEGEQAGVSGVWSDQVGLRRRAWWQLAGKKSQSRTATDNGGGPEEGRRVRMGHGSLEREEAWARHEAQRGKVCSRGKMGGETWHLEGQARA